MNTKQLTYPSIQEQQKYWIDKEAKENNATPETREAIAREAAYEICQHHARHRTIWKVEDAVSIILLAMEKGIQAFLGEHDGHTLNVSRTGVASNLNRPDSTTADPKPKDIGGNELPDRIEANEDWYEVERNDFDRGDLRDEGRNPNGDGESYAERNL